MSVYNPNLNFPNKKKRPQPEIQRRGGVNLSRRAGAVSSSSISWNYDFRPLRKWLIIILSMLVVFAIAYHFQQAALNNQMQKSIAVEAKDVKQRYLVKRLEALKKETIATEQLRLIRENKAVNYAEPVKRTVISGKKYYTWTNENGQTIYSNHPRRD